MLTRLTAVQRRLLQFEAFGPLEWTLLLLLLPSSLLYGAALWLRNLFYDSGLLPSYRSILPVLSVGNISVGGTGKTPVVDAIVREALARGCRPAIVSRGYGGSYSGRASWVRETSEMLMAAAECGDEPFLLAQRNPQCPLVVARIRAEGIRLIEQKQCADLIILDDAFQHRAVRRDIDLVLLDAQRPLGNRWPLPAGNLREFAVGLKRADLLLMTRSENPKDSEFQGIKTYHCQHRLAHEAIGLDGSRLTLKQLRQYRAAAFAGIACPEDFFSALESLEVTPGATLALADHSDYRPSILKQIEQMANSAGADILLTTEKDAVKLTGTMFTKPCYYLPLSIEIADAESFFDEVLTPAKEAFHAPQS
jgi:tetraacyldisaccharide 4'-kinase